MERHSSYNSTPGSASAKRRSHRERGSAMVEMTLIGIPIMFVLISIFEISRGMWVYHSLAYAAKEGTRYASVHGLNCSTAPNTCTVTVANIATVIRNAGLGLEPDQLQVRMCASCGVNASGTSDDTGFQTLSALLSNNTTWPNPGGVGAMMHSRITFELRYPFNSALAMFWPGASRVQFGRYIFAATAAETMHF